MGRKRIYVYGLISISISFRVETSLMWRILLVSVFHQGSDPQLSGEFHQYPYFLKNRILDNVEDLISISISFRVGSALKCRFSSVSVFPQGSYLN